MIGQGSYCDLVIESPGIKKVHCRIIVQCDRNTGEISVFLENLSQTGTCVNGKLVSHIISLE